MKLKLKKLQSGGGIPDLVTLYTPVTVSNQLGDIALSAALQYILNSSKGAGSSASQSSASSSNDNITKLLSSLLKGLDNDVQAVSKALMDQHRDELALGVGDQVNNYYNTLALVNKVLLSYDQYEKARDTSIKRNSVKDVATTSNGLVVMKDNANDSLTFVLPEEVREYQESGKYQILTQGNLLYERAHNPNFTFSYGDNISRIVMEGASMDEIRTQISDIVKLLGTQTISENGYVLKENNQIKNGISILKNLAKENIESMPMDGIYLIKYDNTSQLKSAEMAIGAVWGNLTPGLRALLLIQTLNGTLKEALDLIGVMIASGVNINSRYNINYTDIKTTPVAEAVQGASKMTASKLTAKELNIDESPVGAWWRGKGEKKLITITTDSSQGITTKANIMPIIDSENKALGINLSLYKVSMTPIGAVLDLLNISMGNGALINPSAVALVIVGSEIAAADLPIDQKTLYDTGHIIPAIKNLKLISLIENTLLHKYNINVNKINSGQGLDLAIKKRVNEEYLKNNLPAKYNKDGTLNAQQWRRFALLNGTTVETSFIGEQNLSDLGLNIDDESRKLYVRNVQLNGLNDFDIDNGWVAGLGADDVFSGTLFIPLSNSYMPAMFTSGSRAYNSPDLYNYIDRLSDENQRMIESGGIKLDVSKFNE